MAVSYKKKYTNEAELVYDIAQSSNLFNVDTYNELLSTGKGEDYTYAIAGTLDKAVDSFNLDYYNLLNSDDKYTYILNEYYVDRNETAVDESTGETYNIYDRNNEYIQAKIDEAIDLQTYNSLDGFTKTLATIGGFIGNAINELFLGTIEGIVDLGAVALGQKEWAAQDFTGVAANREALQRFNRAYTFIDKNSVVSTMNDVFTGLVQMAPLAIPGAGQAIYFGAMAGNSASEAVRANPDINYLTLLGYTASVTLVEYGTEKISNVFFGGSAIDKLVFKTSSSKAGSWITRMGLDFLSEGLEESISEFANSVLYTAMIDPNAPLASIQDILYAGLVGGLTGAVAAGGQIATTRKQTILADGTIVDSKTAKTLGYEGKSLSKTQSLTLMEQISKAKNILDTDAVADLQAKYSKESLEEIKTKHSKEYNKAVESNKNKQTLLTESVLGLNKIYETLGAEGFQKVTDIANYTIEQQRTLLSNYVDAAEGRTTKYKEVESKYRAINPNSSFTVSEDLSATELRLRDGIKKATGIDVYFGTLGERDGVKRQNGITLDEKTIVLDKSLSSTMSLDSILNQVVKEELVHTLQYQSGILDINTINDLMEEYNKLGGQQTEAMRTEEAYRNKSDLTKISEAQAKSLAQVLLFDKISVSRIFFTNNSTFNKVYKWMNKLKTTIETLKEFRTPKGKIKYRTLLRTMDMYRSVVAESIGNDEDANIAAKEMNLTDEQLQKLIDTYVSDYTNEHYTLLTSQYTLHSEQRMKAEKALIEARAGGIVMRYLPLDFNNIYEPAYYTEDFRRMITDRNPYKDFRYNLQEYLITEYGFTINQADRCLMEVVDLNKVTTKEFDMTLSDMIADPNAISKYSNLAQIFNDHFVEKFITIDGTNQLADIDLKVVYRPTDQSVKAQYSRLDSETNKPTITVFLKENTVLNNSQIDVLKHNIFHEVTHALADIQGLQNGTSTNYVKSALLETDDSTIQKLGKLLLTKSFYEENKTNKNILIDNIAYGIYRITDGEYAAESYKNSITRKDEYEINLKAGATMNRSGFRTDGNVLYGYGRFSGIELQAKTIVNQKAQYRLEALRQAYEVVSYQRVSDLRNYFAQKGITDFEKAGFSTEFVDALENDTLSVDSIWDMIDTNTIGSPEATKMMIEWLKPENKHMTTMDAIEKAKALGIAYAAVYDKVQKNTNPDYDSSKSMSYSELTNFIEQNPKYFTLVTKQMSSLANLLDQNKNSRINRWLIRNDYDYSGDSTTYLLSVLKGQYGINSKNETISTTSSDGETSVVDLIEDTSQSPERQLIAEEEGVSEETSVSDTVETVDDVIAGLKDNISKIGDSAELFKLRNTIENNKDILIKKYGEDGYKRILENAPVAKSTYTKRINRLKKQLESRKDLTVKEQAIINQNTSDLTPSEYEAYITRLEGITKTEKPSAKTNTSNSDKAVTEKQEEVVIKEKPVKEVLKETPKVKSKQPIKKESSKNKIEQIKESRKVTSDKVKEQENAFKSKIIGSDIREKTTKLIEMFDEKKLSISKAERTTDYYTVATQKAVEDNKEFFDSLSSKDVVNMLNELQYEDPEKTFEQLSQQNAASIVLLRYADSKKNTQFKDIKEWIVRKQSLASDYSSKFMGGLSADYGEHSIKSFVTEVTQYSENDITIPEDLLKKNITDGLSIDDFKTSLLEKIEDLESAIKSEKDGQLRWELKQELKYVNNLYDVLDEGDYASALDVFVTHLRDLDENQTENFEKISEIYFSIIDFLVNNVDPTDKFKATKSKALSPETRKKIYNAWSAVKSFRYLAMLSSPTTWGKNAINNTAVSGLAIVEDFIAKGIENKNLLSNDHQVKFYGSYNSDFSSFIDKTFAAKISQDTSGDKYNSNERDTLRAEYAKENDPLRKSKLLNAIKKVEEKALSDKRWTSRRVKRNLKNMLAGASNQILYESESSLLSRYNISRTKGDDSFKQKLYDKISKTNKELAELYKDAISNSTTSLTSIIKLGLKIKSDIIEAVYNKALYRGNKLFFKVDNALSRAESRLIRKHPVLAGVLNIFMPFVRVTFNTTAYIIDRSPIGLAKGFVKYLKTKNMFVSDIQLEIYNYYKSEYIKLNKKPDQDFTFTNKKFKEWCDENLSKEVNLALNGDKTSILKLGKILSDQGKISLASVGSSDIFARAETIESISQGLTGTTMMIVGMILSAVLDVFDYEDDDDYLGAILKIGNIKIRLSDISPFATMFSMGAMLTSDAVDDKMEAFLSTLYDQTLLNIIDSAWTYSNGPLDFIENQSINYIQSFIPVFTKNVNKMLSNSKKDKSGDFFEKLWKTTLSNTIIFNHLVANKINPYTGQPERYYESGILEGLLNAFSPIGFRIDSKSDIQIEAERLGAKTTGFAGSFTINGEDIDITGSKKEKLAKYRADYINSVYDDIVNGRKKVTVEDENGKRITTTYDKLTDDQKSKVLQNLYSDATEKTKIKYWTDNGHYYVTSNIDSYNELKKLFGSGILYRTNWNKSKYMN